ncbi:MAG: APC family permease [Defluviitaleaceae bacterium]|nr:APC family permease [Defluviitaleaceae bacterium]
MNNSKNVLKRQHGLFVSICFVVGFLVGTGIFFLPGRVLYEVGGNVGLGIAAWVIGGLMIAPCVYMFSIFAGRYEKIHGFVDYSEVIVGKRYGYLAGWFFAVMYQPAGFAIIAWITSGFTATLAGMVRGDEMYLPFRFFISAFFMAMTFFMNYFAPKVPVRLNVATTVVRMIPLVLMGTVGVVVGLFVSRGDVSGIDTSYTPIVSMGNASLFAAISATAFAFNGWQAALAFNSEVKNSKRNFPIALMLGFGMIIVVYVLYFIGIATSSPSAVQQIMQGGGDNFAQGTHSAFESIFGQAGSILVGFMIISGLGILNACCLGMSRAMYSLGRRGMGPMPLRMAALDTVTNVPNNSMVMAVSIGFIWLFVIFANQAGWFGSFSFSLPDFYNFSFFGLLIPIFICFVMRANDVHFFKRFILPFIAIAGAGFMFATYWIGSFIHGIVYTVTFIVLATIGFLMKKSN